MLTCAIIVAGKKIDKISEKSLLHLSLLPFVETVDQIAAVTPPEFADYYKNELSYLKAVNVVTGELPPLPFSEDMSFVLAVGKGLASLGKEYEIVAVHEGVRPFVLPEEIKAVLKAAEETPAVIGTRVIDTVKNTCITEGGSIVLNTIDRRYLWNILSPFAIKGKVLHTLLGRLMEKNIYCTNCGELVTHLNKENISIKLIEGRYENVVYNGIKQV